MYVRLAFAVAIHVDAGHPDRGRSAGGGRRGLPAQVLRADPAFQERGGTLLFVSHDVAAVRTLCDRAVYLEQGQIKDHGLAGPVVDHYLRDIHEALITSVHPPPEDPVDRSPRLLRRAIWPYNLTRFETEFARQRQGTGEVRIRLAEIVDEAGESIELARSAPRQSPHLGRVPAGLFCIGELQNPRPAPGRRGGGRSAHHRARRAADADGRPVLVEYATRLTLQGWRLHAAVFGYPADCPAPARGVPGYCGNRLTLSGAAVSTWQDLHLCVSPNTVSTRQLAFCGET